MTPGANPEKLKIMPKRSDAYMETRRRQIVDAALNCIVTQGWNRTTIEDVCAAAGLSKGAIYVHFANKRALLFGLLERNFEDIEAAASIDTFDKLRAWVTADYETLAGPNSWRIIAGSLEAVVEGVRDPEIRTMFGRAYTRLVEILTEVVGRMRPDLPTATVKTHVLTLILLNDGMRAFRTVSDGLSKPAMRAVIDQALLPLNPANKSKR
jgi:AcrR family transcriptional regulator